MLKPSSKQAICFSFHLLYNIINIVLTNHIASYRTRTFLNHNLQCLDFEKHLNIKKHFICFCLLFFTISYEYVYVYKPLNTRKIIN